MPAKRKSLSATPTKKPRRAKKPAAASVSWVRLVKLYPSLAQGPTPAERLAKFLRTGPGRKAMTEQELESWIEECRDLWPDDKEIDAFIAWVHRGRRTGRYE